VENTQGKTALAHKEDIPHTISNTKIKEVLNILRNISFAHLQL